MSFASCEATVRSGDVVIVYLSHDQMIPITVKPDETTQTKYGAMKHNDLIGHQYGKKFSCSKVSRTCLSILQLVLEMARADFFEARNL